MKGLTKRQSEIISFIGNFIETHQFSPSYREIGEHFGYSSLGTVYKHIQILIRKGCIEGEKKGSRSLSLADKATKNADSIMIELPFIGLISAGSPIETFPTLQTLTIPNFLIHAPEKTYILRAQGDSLIDEQICHGDLLIVEAKSEAHPGEIVVALVNQHETIIKRYYHEGQYVRLEGSIPNHQPIILKPEHLSIQGVLIGLMRLYH